MMAAIASRAAWLGPSGFSLESMITASLGCGARRWDAANMGSFITRNAAAAEAAAERCRKDRLEKRGMETSGTACTAEVRDLTTEGAESAGKICWSQNPPALNRALLC